MNQIKRCSIFVFMMLITTSALAEINAVEIFIGGKGPAVDAVAFETVKQVIGHAVGNGVVDKFIVSGYGIEGGFSACAQASGRTKGFGLFVKQLRAIKPNPETTGYSVSAVDACIDFGPQ
jgi:hypothetical protein